MKIKTIRIKIEDDIQEFNVTDFGITSATLYDKIAHVVQEADGLYWHVMIFYQPSYTSTVIKETKVKYRDEIESEISKYFEQCRPSTRVRNGIYQSISQYKEIKTREDFRRVKNIGRSSIRENQQIFDYILKSTINIENPSFKIRHHPPFYLAGLEKLAFFTKPCQCSHSHRDPLPFSSADGGQSSADGGQT